MQIVQKLLIKIEMLSCLSKEELDGQSKKKVGRTDFFLSFIKSLNQLKITDFLLVKSFIPQTAKNN